MMSIPYLMIFAHPLASSNQQFRSDLFSKLYTGWTLGHCENQIVIPNESRSLYEFSEFSWKAIHIRILLGDPVIGIAA